MPHEIDRVLRAFSESVWLIEPRKAEQIIAALEMRAGNPAAFADLEPPERLAEAERAEGGAVAVLRMHGTILPRAGMMGAMSGGVSLEAFRRNFRQVADDPSVRAIVLDIDSPGGQVDLVPETAALVRAARRADRPIVAVANTLMASAAYWIGAAADEIVVSPSGVVGSIGVLTMHKDVSRRAEAEGIAVTYVFAGPRKVEGNPFQPLDDEARAALQADVDTLYGMFVADVAKARGVPKNVVRADPVKAERHFGGGRTLNAEAAVAMGMADRVGTFEDTLARAAGRKSRRASIERRRLALT